MLTAVQKRHLTIQEGIQRLQVWASELPAGISTKAKDFLSDFIPELPECILEQTGTSMGVSLQDQVLRCLAPTAALTNTEFSNNVQTTEQLSRSILTNVGTGLRC